MLEQIAVVSMLVALTHAGLPSLRETQNICENGWHEYRNPDTNHVTCIRAYTEKRSWVEAQTFCKGLRAHLFKIDLLYYSITNPEQQLFLLEYLFRTLDITDTWTGMHIDNGRFMWDSYGPEYVIQNSQGQRGWDWIPDELDTKGGKCVHAAINPEITEIGLQPCSTQLSFVCQKPSIVHKVVKRTGCGEGWFGNKLSAECYTILQVNVTHADGKSKCAELGGTLPLADTPFELAVLYEVYSQTITTNDISINGFWVESATPRDIGCPYVDVSLAGLFFFIRDDCDLPGYMACQKAISIPETDTITFSVNSPLLNQTELLLSPPFTPHNLTAQLNRPLLDDEVLFIRTPEVILNSTRNFENWLLYMSFNNRHDVDFRTFSLPTSVSVPLPPSQETPQRRKRNLDNRRNPYQLKQEDYTQKVRQERGIFKRQDNNIPEDGLLQGASLATGHFSFGVYSYGTQQYVESQPVLIRYAESDWFTFIVMVKMSGSSQQIISARDATLFNLLQDVSYVQIVREFTGSVLNSRPRIEIPSIIHYSGYLYQINHSTTTLTFRVMVSIVDSRSYELDVEESLRRHIQSHWQTELFPDIFDINSTRVLSTVSCGLRTVPTEVGTMFTLPITRIGEIGYSWERCFQGEGALAYATCEGDFENGAKWGNITIKDCEMIPTHDESTSTPALKNLSETVLNETNVIPVLKETVTLTVPEVNLTEADVIYIADILYNVLQLDVINPTTLDLMYEIINNLLSSDTRIIDEAQTINNAANRIIRAVEEITSGIVLFDDSTLRYVRPFIASEIRSQSGTGDLYIGVGLKKTPTTDIQNSSLFSVGMPSDVNASESDTAIYLTEQLVSGVLSKLTFQIYGKSDLFSTVNGRYKVNSKVAAAKLYQNGRQIINLGSEYVTSVFYPLEDTDGIVCGYWDYFADEDAGGWKTDGCKTNITSDRVICQCDHLTNFAVLIDLEAHTISDTDKLVLGIITKVGLAISIVGQGLTILTFVLFKHLRSGRGQQVLVNLSAAMLCSSVIFLVGMERTESIVGCKIVAALLHYFILVSFMWMLVEGLLQYLRFVKVLGTYIPKFMLKTAIPSWGIPLIPVIIVLAIDHDLYYAGKGYCWLAYDAMLYAFIIPVAVVIFINIIVFFMVLCNLLKRRKKGMQSNQSERKMALLHFQAALSILVILGLTWVFGFMALTGAKIVFHYLFAIFNAFQGFFIFIMFTAREKQIRKAWRKMCCKGSEYKSTSGVDSQPRKLHSGTNSTNTDSGAGKGHHKNGSDTGLTFNNPEFENR